MTRGFKGNPLVPGHNADRVDVAAGPEALALHLVSAHCDPMAIARPAAENTMQHDHEHDGRALPDHHSSIAWLGYDDANVEAVLEKAENER